LALKQKQTANKKAETKKKELQEFVQRFSANASKSKQATSRKKLLDKINLDDIQASSRRYPGIIWSKDRDAGNQLLKVENLSAKDNEGNYLFKDMNFVVNKGDKISILGESRAVSAFFEIVNNNRKPDSGEFEFGQTITTSYLPSDNTDYFKSSENLVDWLRNYTEGDKDEVYIRGFLGKMLFSGEEVMKKCSVLSGGEKMRCMLSKMMQKEANFLMLDEPTNHLDLESITALNESLINFTGTILFTSHDHTFTHTVATRIIEIGPNGMLDKEMSYDDFLESGKIAEQRESIV
jgi:ATPase subunit of ABC transporter with duplicated ATPase domains